MSGPDPYAGSEQDLALDTAQLYRAGAEELPAMADLLSSTLAAMPDDGTTRPAFTRTGGVGLGADGPWTEWSQLADSLRHALRSNRNTVRRTGEALCEVAEMFAETDDTIKGEFDRRRQRIDGRAAREDRRRDAMPAPDIDDLNLGGGVE